jgi:hypothetical protein
MKRTTGSWVAQRARARRPAHTLPQTLLVTVGQLARERRLVRASAPADRQKNRARMMRARAEVRG